MEAAEAKRAGGASPNAGNYSACSAHASSGNAFVRAQSVESTTHTYARILASGGLQMLADAAAHGAGVRSTVQSTPRTGGYYAISKRVRDEILLYKDNGMTPCQTHAAMKQNSANGSVSLSTIRRLYHKVEKYGCAVPRKRTPTYSSREAEAIQHWVRTQTKIFSVNDLFEFFRTTFPDSTVTKRTMYNWLQSLGLSRGVEMPKLPQKVGQPGNSGLVEDMPSAQEETIRAQLGEVFHRARQERYNKDRQVARRLGALAAKVALGDSVQLTLPDHECHQLVQLVPNLDINGPLKQIVQESPEFTNPAIQQHLNQLAGERNMQFADFRTAVQDEKLSIDTFNQLAISLNFRLGWLEVTSSRPTRFHPRWRGRRLCNQTQPAAKIMTGTIVVRAESVDPVKELGAYINKKSRGEDRQGRGAISDALPRHVFNKLSKTYYPNVETPTFTEQSRKHLGKRQNGYDLVRLSRDLLVLAVPYVPGLAEILTAAESLELPSLGLSPDNPHPPPQRRYVRVWSVGWELR